MLLTLLVLCLGLHCSVCLELSHLDLELANRTCDGKASCELGRGSRFGDDLDWRDRNCLCDKQCTRYGDCCLDSPHFDVAEQRRGVASFSCVDLRQFGGIYMMTSCPPSWGNPQVRAMCETGSDNLQDPISGLPATSHNSSITFRNSYCALCHHDEKQLDLWRPRIECPSLSIQHNLTRDNLPHLLIFNKTKNSWGLTLNNTFHVCSIDPVLPETSTHVIRRCQADTIKTCAVNWTNTDVRNRCEAYTSMVYEGNKAYRNPHCAVCNNVPLQFLQCSKILLRTFFTKDFSPVAFAVLFDLSGGRSQVGKFQPCNESQLYDPFFKKCRDVITEISQSSTLIEPSEFNQTLNVELNQTDKNNLRNESLNIIEYYVTEPQTNPCPKFVLGHEDYIVTNKSVFVPAYERTFYKNEFTLHDDGSLEVCVEALGIKLIDKFGAYMGYVTFAGLGVSIIFLILHLSAFALVPELRNLSGKNLASLCLALLAAYSTFMAGQILKGTPCFVVAVITYYSFLASFSWMLTMAFDVWRTLRLATAELRVSAGKQWRKFTIYSIWSWLAPAIILTSTLLIETAPKHSIPNDFRPDFGVYSCWFGQRKALLIYFAVPLAIVMILNIIFFASSAHMIYSTTSTTRFTASAGTQRDFRLYIRLALVMGLTWTVGLIAGTLDNELLWYAFIALNTLQGLFIFLAFTCTEKVIRGLALRRTDSRPLRPPSFSWSGASTDSTRKSHMGSEQGTTDTLY